MTPWTHAHKGDSEAVKLADRHYSRRKVGSPQFMPPGQTIVLKLPGAVWGWWRPAPESGFKAMNGLDGWTCSIFRNESEHLSSTLILAAELALAELCGACGPDGMITYVWCSKIRSMNPGACYQRAGWKKTGWSKDGKKRLLQKPFELAGWPPEHSWWS